MTGHVKQPRPDGVTAREVAERTGKTARTVRRYFAEDREDFEGRAAARRERAAELRAEGKTYREIADDMGVSTGTVGRLLHEWRKQAGIPQPGRGRRNTTIPMGKRTA